MHSYFAISSNGAAVLVWKLNWISPLQHKNLPSSLPSTLSWADTNTNSYSVPCGVPCKSLYCRLVETSYHWWVQWLQHLICSGRIKERSRKPPTKSKSSMWSFAFSSNKTYRVKGAECWWDEKSFVVFHICSNLQQEQLQYLNFFPYNLQQRPVSLQTQPPLNQKKRNRRRRKRFVMSSMINVGALQRIKHWFYSNDDRGAA